MSKLYFTDRSYKEYIDGLLSQAINFEVDNLISRTVKIRFPIEELKLRDRISEQLENDLSIGDNCPDIDIALMKDYIVTILTRYIKALTMGLEAGFSEDMVISICTMIVKLELKDEPSKRDFINLYLDDITRLVKQFKNLLLSLETFTNLMILDLTLDSLN